ncbi:hypothetical protein ACFQZQ_03905 [Lysobacter koreensis]|uniref:Uncharacterized protein n=1 Tax=Lysobacter koreensis TaxID=266122 RepID=A0ABW2YLA2_9GAMM
MARPAALGNVIFEVALADGSEHDFTVDSYALRGGDEVALEIARDRQRAGRLPPGEIIAVRRLPGYR